MKREVLSFLKSYSYNPYDIDRLIVSTFLYSNNIDQTKNEFLKPLIILENDNDYKSLVKFLRVANLKEIEQLIELFEFVVSPEEKIVTGAVYTPYQVREFIINQTHSRFESLENIKICDPACGCAGFLINSAQYIKNKTNLPFKKIFSQSLFGLDIQEYSIKRSKILLTLFALLSGEDEQEFHFNLFIGNALNFNWDSNIPFHSGFDIVLGNPPYVCSRNIDVKSKELLSAWDVCSTGHPDLYIPFFEIGLSCLKPNGLLGYITMNTFFKSVNGRALRKYFQERKYIFEIIDFGGLQVFNSRSTYTCLCFIQKKKQDYLKYIKLPSLESLLHIKPKYTRVNYLELNAFNGWNLQEVEIIGKIESIGTPLGERFKSRNGIATLKNNIFIFNPIKEDDKYFYLFDDIINPIEKGICKDIINPNKLNKFSEIDPIKRKIIFPYTIDNVHVRLIKEDVFKNTYPKSYEYLERKKGILANRDKGQGKYENWYAYGRNQCLEKIKYKLFFPHITPSTPNFILNDDENLLFYNGLAIIGQSERELLFLIKLMSSRLFWFYIINTSKPYGSGYYSLSRTYFKNFGIPEFTDAEIDRIISETHSEILNNLLETKYAVTLPQ